MNKTIKSFFLGLISLILIFAASCDANDIKNIKKTPENTPISSEKTEKDKKVDVALVYPAEYISNESGMHDLINKYNLIISKMADEFCAQLTYFYVQNDGEKLVLDEVYNWADSRTNNAIVLLYQNMQIVGETELKAFKDKDLTVGILGVDYRGFSDDIDKELDENELTENLDFNILMDCGSPLGRYAAQTFAKKFDGKSGYILLNTVESTVTPNYYQSFFEEFDKQKDDYDLSGIIIRDEYDDINMTAEEQIASLKNDKGLLGVVDNRGVNIDKFWHEVLSSENVSGISIFSNTSFSDSGGNFNDGNSYYYVTEPLDKVVIAGIKTGIEKINGMKINKVQTIYGELLK